MGKMHDADRLWEHAGKEPSSNTCPMPRVESTR